MKREIVNRRNKTIDLRKFNKRITKWAMFDELDDASDSFLKKSINAYGRDFIIKRNNVSKRFAIFIDENNKLRRMEDKKLSFNIGDLLISKMWAKREGVSIFKIYEMLK